MLLKCTLLFLYLSVCLCQRDCTGVDCPLLDNCIEEVLESGSCCASCLQKGCTCEGYQYYDCINAGFKNGKVPEGDSYFVDYGSTECACPRGGGRISCHFISCPDIPPNCIEVLEPADGCMQCERIGCVNGGQKYEAGHSFHIDSCRVCHCPNEGGKLMCYQVPDCDPDKVHKPMLAAPTDVMANSRDSYPYRFDKLGHMDPFSTTYHLPPNGNLPLFKSPPSDKEEPDYDYGPTDFPETYPQSLVFPTQSSSLSRGIAVSRGSDRPDRTSAFQSFDRRSKLELREQYGVRDHPAEKEEVTESPLRGTVTPHDEEGLDEEKMEEEEIVTLQNVTGPEEGDVPYNIESAQQERGHEESDSSIPAGSYETTTPEPSTSSPRWPEYSSTPMVHFITTTQPPVRVRLHESKPSRKPGQSLVNLHSENQEEVKEEVTEKEEERKDRPVVLDKPDGSPGVYAEDLLQSCCANGQRWATENHHCNHMPLLNNDKHSICSVAQKQCCLSSIKENQCESGITSARGGDTCEVSQEDQCTDDSYQASLTSLSHYHWNSSSNVEGRGCNAHQYLGYPCGHVFLTCCEEEEGPSQLPLRRKQKPRPTAIPRKVSDSKFPKEAFSISATDEAANAVVEQDDVDECQLYPGQLCQHTCTNIWGSYRCGCHPGYILQPDGHFCAPVSPDEDNRVREEDSLAVIPTQTTPTSTTTSTFTISPVHLNPCAENGPCSQQCTVVAGRAHCSCFPGFSLMTDGRMCEGFAVTKKKELEQREFYSAILISHLCSSSADVDECVTNTHSCRPSERCVNTVGSFVCELQVTCPAGHQLRNSVCEDIDECVLRTHNCGTGLVCENTVGSFLCTPKNKCMTGFTQDSHGNCIDINECSSLSEPCSSGFNCINTVGSYTCQQKTIMCSHGYHASPDGSKCVDIDECQMGTHRCGAGKICHNLVGSYRCDCQTGYQYDALRKVCTGMYRCVRLCAQTCENTPGSYHCSCTAGFSLAFDGKNCEDVNECDKNPCSQECANIYGSYQCYCRQGYYLKEDGHTCEDIDECSQSIGNLCTFQCVNVAGSYQCACPSHGYVMSANGRTCRDIDECTTGTHNCSYGQNCYNLQGGFKCLSFDCPHNYKKVSDTRCERISCPSNSLDCQNSPVRITYYQLSFQTNIIIPAQIFRIGPSPAYSGDHIVISIIKGNEEGYFSTRKLNSFTGAVYLKRQVREPKDFLIDVEMKLLRQGTFTSFLARIYVFITSSTM
eukprot:superscaffoldBa00000053_g899